MSDQPKESEERLEKLREQLNHFHNWPSTFTFKFILPACEIREQQLRDIFQGAQRIQVRASKNGNYFSFTIAEHLQGPDEVFDRYSRAGQIKDILSM